MNLEHYQAKSLSMSGFVLGIGCNKFGYTYKTCPMKPALKPVWVPKKIEQTETTKECQGCSKVEMRNVRFNCRK